MQTTDDLSNRNGEILKAIIQDFIATGEPVGSQTIAPRCDVSSATVRAAMADLEALGYIEKPHTSAGRVPTDRGYRIYVDSLLHIRAPQPKEKEMIERSLQPAAFADLIADTGRLLHELTHHAAVVVAPMFNAVTFKRIELVLLRENRVLAVLVSSSGQVQNRLITTDFQPTRDEMEHATNYLNDILANLTLEEVHAKIGEEIETERALYDELVRKSLTLCSMALGGATFAPQIVIEGEASFLEHPEFAEDLSKIRSLFTELAQKDRLLHLLRRTIEGRDVRIFIGAESQFSKASGVSLISAPYSCGKTTIGALAVLGPTRMNYGRIIPLVEYTAKAMSRTFAEN